MKKLNRIVLLLMCVAALVLGLVACQNNTDGGTDGKVTYTVNVVCPEDDITLPDVLQVKLLKSDGSDAATAQRLVDGKATFELEPGTYKVAFLMLPTKYATPDATLTATTRTVTITITDKASEEQNTKVVYKVKLLTPEDEPVADVAVQLCGGIGDSYACHQMQTDANGVATYELVAGNYDIHVASSEWPSGLIFDDEKYKVTTADKDTTVTVYFDKVVTYGVRVKYAATKNDNGEDVDARPASGIVVSLYREYKHGVYSPTVTGTGKTDADGVAAISVPQADYLVKLSCPAGYTYTEGLIISRDQKPTEKFDITLSERGSSESSAFTLKVGETTVGVTKKADYLYYNFDAQGKPGVYEIQASAATGKPSLDTFAVHYVGNASAGLFYPVTSDTEYYKYTEDNSADDKNFTLRFGIKPGELGGGSVFGFKFGARDVADADMPTSFKVKVVFVETIVDTSLPAAEADAGTLKAAPAIEPNTVPTRVEYGGMWSIDYNSTDKYYHKAGVDGPIVYVSVGHGKNGASYLPLVFEENNKDFSEAYAESGGIGFSFVNKDGTLREDYGKFLAAYKAAANADGLYPLTSDMLWFLQNYAASGLAYNLGVDPDNCDDLYLFACYTYENIYEKTIGAGTSDSPYEIHRVGDYLYTADSATTIYVKATVGGKVTLASGDAKLHDSTGAEVADGALTVEIGTTFTVVTTGATDVILSVDDPDDDDNA